MREPDEQFRKDSPEKERLQTWAGLVLLGVITVFIVLSMMGNDTSTDGPPGSSSVAEWNNSYIVERRLAKSSDLLTIFFAADMPDSKLLSLARECVNAHADDARGVKCYGYRTPDDVAFDAPDDLGHVQHTCFRVRSQIAPDGTRYSSGDTGSVRSPRCP